MGCTAQLMTNGHVCDFGVHSLFPQLLCIFVTASGSAKQAQSTFIEHTRVTLNAKKLHKYLLCAPAWIAVRALLHNVRLRDARVKQDVNSTMLKAECSMQPSRLSTF